MFDENIVVARQVNLLILLILAAYPVLKPTQQRVALEGDGEGLHEDQMQNVRVADSQESCLADLAVVVVSSSFLSELGLAIIGQSIWITNS